MNVLHVIWNLGQGGAQKYLLDLLTAFANRTCADVLVQAGPGPLSDDVERQCRSITYLNMRSGFDIFGLIRLIRYLKNSRVDLIHSHSNNFLFNLALQFQSKPVVYTEHGGRLLEKNRADRLIYRLLYRPIKCFIAISEYMAGVMVAENPDISARIRVIYNGVEVDAIEASPRASAESGGAVELPTGRKVGFVGRLVPQKGVEYFIDTAARLSKIVPDVQFVIVGDGPLLGELRGRVSKHAIEDRVHFLGYRKDAVSLMKSFDVMLFTSRYEPFGLVIAEALAAGVPIVAMDEVGAVSEIIRNGLDGAVVKGLDVESAAHEVARLLDDPALARRMADAGRERVRAGFTIAQNAEKVQAVYRSVLGMAKS